MNLKSPDILWVDDEHIHIQYYLDELEMEGFTVRIADSVSEAKRQIESQPPNLVILDVMMPNDDPDSQIETHGGHRTGIALGKWIKQNFPDVPFLGCSVARTSEIIEFFTTHGAGFLTKPMMLRDIIHCIKKALKANPKTLAAAITPFIVHGHDEEAKLNLKNFLQNRIGFAEPIILHEQPSLGRTILEKFEQESKRASIVFVLLTPDDKGAAVTDSNAKKRRARQNVIFEMGYFLGALGRTSGRVLLLYKEPLELPSDLSGTLIHHQKKEKPRCA